MKVVWAESILRQDLTVVDRQKRNRVVFKSVPRPIVIHLERGWQFSNPAMS